MLNVLRTVFTVLSVLCVVGFFVIGTFFDWVYALLCVLGALVFFVPVLLIRDKQENDARQPDEVKDFINNGKDN